MLADDLHRPVSPTMPLGFESQEGIWKQTPSITLAGVMGVKATGQQAQAQFGVLHNGVGGPAARLVEGGTLHHQHGAMGDDGVVLVALHHANVEKAGIFRIHDGF